MAKINGTTGDDYLDGGSGDDQINAASSTKKKMAPFNSETDRATTRSPTLMVMTITS